jgi:hypothetical protein
MRPSCGGAARAAVKRLKAGAWAMVRDRGDFTVHAGDPPPAPGAGTGHYFDQTVFDMHYRLLSARAQRMAEGADWSGGAFEVDTLGNVTLKAIR